jgi:hypothetical protein
MCPERSDRNVIVKNPDDAKAWLGDDSSAEDGEESSRGFPRRLFG